MTEYTIERFWMPRLESARHATASLIPGWRFVDSGLNTFKEAPLTLSTDLGDTGDPERAALLLVSAPGAVGKSTLARQIAFRTGSIYLDLAAAGPVGDNTLSGGLFQSRLAQNWQGGSIALLIDGLDEARLRVTQEAFEAFLHDVARLSRDRELPTVLFGRTGAIEDASLVLYGQAVESALFEIGYYGPPQAIAFAEDLVRHLRPNDAHLRVRLTAAELLLSGLRQQTEQDGNRFAGYAPVLAAVADRVASESNPGALVSGIKSGSKSVTLQSVVDAILDREHTKLQSLTFEDSTLVDKLYLPMEQLDHLVAQRYGTKEPARVAAMSNKDEENYEHALETWVAEHPFLGGGGNFLGGGGNSPSVVFDAAITGHALGSSEAAEDAVQREFRRDANPFLSVFYPRESRTTASGSHCIHLPAEHIGIVYNSVRARLALSETASLLVAERDDLGDGDDAVRMDVEISMVRNDEERHERTLLKFVSTGTGAIRIGPHLADAEIDVPHGRITIGTGTDVALVAPINIECEKIELTAEKFIVAASPRESLAAAVVLNGQRVDAFISGSPILRGNVNFYVSWPGSQTYPWSRFAVHMKQVDEQHVKEGLQRLRRLVTAFRAGGKDQLARIKDKIESPRMMKGLGHAILQAMMKERVVYSEGKLYILDASALGEVVGVTYIDCLKQRFPEKAIAFVRRAGACA